MVMRSWLPGVICTVLLAGCSRHYDAALREIALPSEQRLASRIVSLEESAWHALAALEAGAEVVGRVAVQGSTRPMARQARLVNDADAAVFAFARQALMLADVVSSCESSLIAAVEPLHSVVVQARESLAAAMSALRDREVGSLTANYSGHAGTAAAPDARPDARPDPRFLSEHLRKARSDVAALSGHSEMAMAAIAKEGKVQARLASKHEPARAARLQP